MPRKYDLELKLEAVRMASEHGVANREMKRQLGIVQGVLCCWKRQLKDDGAQVFPGNGRLTPEDGRQRLLKRENEWLRRELGPLKRPAAS